MQELKERDTKILRDPNEKLIFNIQKVYEEGKTEEARLIISSKQLKLKTSKTEEIENIEEIIEITISENSSNFLIHFKNREDFYISSTNEKNFIISELLGRITGKK